MCAVIRRCTRCGEPGRLHERTCSACGGQIAGAYNEHEATDPLQLSLLAAMKRKGASEEELRDTCERLQRVRNLRRKR